MATTVSSTSSISNLIPTAAPTSASATAKALKDAVAQTLTTSLGAGQFDVPTIAKAIATADVANKRQDFENKQMKGQTKLAGYDILKNALAGISAGLAKLNKPATFNSMSATTSDSTVLSASVTGKPSAGIYSLMVNQRAQAHTLASPSTASQYAALGTGTLNLTVGGSSKAITIDSSNNTLQGLKSAINAAGLPVNASIVNDGTGYRLVLAGQQTGQGNAISLDAVDDDGNNTDAAGISQFVFGNGTNNMTQTIAAQDAQFSVNGLSLTSPNNTAAGVIDGVSLNLNKAQPGVAQTLTIASDAPDLTTKIQNFVDDMNAMHDVINYLGSYKKDPNDPNKGSLAGEAALKQVQSKMREFLQFRNPAGGTIQSMADIGITSNLDGTLTLDTTKLGQAIAADTAGVGQLFSATATATDNQVTYTASSDKTVEGKYNLNIVQAARQALYLGNAATGLATDPITITAGNNNFALTVNGTTTNSLSLAAGTYSRSSLAQMMQSAINNDTNLKAKGITVQVSFDATNNRYQMSTDQFGSASQINFTSLNASLVTDMGLVTGTGATGSYSGQDVMGSLEQGGNSYTFAGTGQHVKINSFLTGAPRDLEFDIAGTATGARGTLDFHRGFASQMTKSITDMLEVKNGAIGSKVAALTKKDTDFTAELAKVQTRYEQLLAQYTKQFSIVNSTISSMNNLKTTLSQTFKAN